MFLVNLLSLNCTLNYLPFFFSALHFSLSLTVKISLEILRRGI